MYEAQGSWLKGYARSFLSLKPGALSLLLFASACASAPPAANPPSVRPPVVTWEEKLGWILRLEDQRLIRDPNPPAQVILVPATKGRPAIVAPPPPSDLLRLLTDDEARTLVAWILAMDASRMPPRAQDAGKARPPGR